MDPYLEGLCFTQMYGNRVISSSFYCPEATKEVSDALVVQYGADKRLKFFY